jgi:YfiH family protein
MIWRWRLERSTWILAPDPLPPAFSTLGFSGRTIHTEARGVLEERPRVRLEQVHSATVTEASAPGVLPACDAAHTRVPGLLLTVRTADCLPVVLGARNEGIALVHAGWRGLAAGILEASVHRFPRPRDLEAWIGPGIGPCCFEVGPEVAAHFPEAVRRRPGAIKPHVDLAAAARGRLERAGLPPGRIRDAGVCTRCHQHLLYSHRGSGGGPGRITAFAAWRHQEP